MFESIFGPVLLTAFVAFLTLVAHFLNFKEKIEKWRANKSKKKFKNNYIENNPDFKISLSYTSNTPPGQCTLNTYVLNLSKETKFIEGVNYNYLIPNNTDKYPPSTIYTTKEKWPKRLEHGEHFRVSVPFQHDLNNSLYSYWQKDIKVYVTCHSTVNDLIKSEPIDYDKLVKFLKPLTPENEKLAIALARKFKCSKRNILATIWQLQIFGWLTSTQGRQFQENNIPVIEYLIENYGFALEKDLWYNWQHRLNELKISDETITDFFKSLLDK